MLTLSNTNCVHFKRRCVQVFFDCVINVYHLPLLVRFLWFDLWHNFVNGWTAKETLKFWLTLAVSDWRWYFAQHVRAYTRISVAPFWNLTVNLQLNNNNNLLHVFTNFTYFLQNLLPLPAGASAALVKPTKYHYYPHNQHIYLLPECAIQQVS